MKIKTIQFIKGITEADYAWDETIPQVAFYGRSNAGKSSTLNTLLNNKTIARTSGQAGKTRQINLFNINNSFHMLDLPGYGFAKGSKAERKNLDNLIIWFVTKTTTEKRMHIIVVDAQVGLSESDFELLEFLYEYNQPILILLNKIDKLNQSKTVQVIRNTKQIVAGTVEVIPFSAQAKKGTNEVWKLIENYIK